MKTTFSALLFFFLASYFLNAQTLPPIQGSDTSKTVSKPEKSAELSNHKKKNNVSNKAYVIQSRNLLNNLASLEEGYTPFEGGQYVIKDYLVKGNVSLVCITYGVAISYGASNSGETSKRYYVHRIADPDLYYEIFLTRKSNSIPTASKILIGGTQNYRGMLNTKKSTGSMVEVSKATLLDLMGDDPDVTLKIQDITKMTVGILKNIVKLYDSKHI